MDKELVKFADDIITLKGVDYVVIASEGFPYLIRGTERETGEYIGATVYSLTKTVKKMGEMFNLGDLDILKIHLNRNDEVLSFDYGNLVVSVKCRTRLERVLEDFKELLEQKKRITCWRCGRDLTFKVYRCPNCDMENSFVARKCWSCSYDLSIKACPYCGAKLTPEGRKPSFFQVLIYKLKMLFRRS